MSLGKRDDAQGRVTPCKAKCFPTRVRRLTAGELTALTAAAATVAASAAFARSAIFAGTSFIDGQSPAADFLAREGLDGCLGAFRSAHGDKTKAAGTAAHAICDKVDFGDWPVCCEKILKIIFSCVEG